MKYVKRESIEQYHAHCTKSAILYTGQKGAKGKEVQGVIEVLQRTARMYLDMAMVFCRSSPMDRNLRQKPIPCRNGSAIRATHSNLLPWAMSLKAGCTFFKRSQSYLEILGTVRMT